MPKLKKISEKVSTLLGPKEDVVKEMFAQGLHWGHKTSKWHPRIKPYLYGTHGTVHVFDLNKTYDCFQAALEYLKECSREGKTILFVGTRGPERELIRSLSSELQMPAVWEEWIGGTFTNFKEIAKRIKYFRELEEKESSGELEKYTKRERQEFHKEHMRMAKKWEGVRNLEKLPDCLFLTNIRDNALAMEEARRVGIPIVAIVDSNADPSLIDFPIPANDDAITSLIYILDKVKEAVLSGKSEKQ